MIFHHRRLDVEPLEESTRSCKGVVRHWFSFFTFTASDVATKLLHSFFVVTHDDLVLAVDEEVVVVEHVHTWWSGREQLKQVCHVAAAGGGSSKGAIRSVK